MPLAAGQMLQGRYRILSMLSQGGMGAVYQAWDTRLDVYVAVKEMTPQPGLDSQTLDQLRRQFRQEATVLARLSHPHLVRVSDFFEKGSNAYLVMDFVEGQSLADLIGQYGALPEQQVLGWAAQLLDALAYCHSKGVIHRDIKPQNVMIRPDGRAVLVDFGLVKLWDPRDPRTKTAMRGMGTPEYAPPEQYGASHTDPRSDVYSLGATLYHALTGQAPPSATDRIAVPDCLPPLRSLDPHISQQTEAAVLRAVELAQNQRWESAAEMARELGLPVPAWQPTPEPMPMVSTQPKEEPTKRTPVCRLRLPALHRSGRTRTAVMSGSVSVPAPRPTTFLRVAAYIGKGLLRLFIDVLLALVVTALVLGLVGTLLLSLVAQYVIANLDWGLKGMLPGQSVLTERDFNEGMASAIEPYTLGAIQMQVDFLPTDRVVLTVSGDLRFHLSGRLMVRDGAPMVLVERLNNIPLVGIGGILSGGINRGLRQAWSASPVRMTQLIVREELIVTEYR